MEKAIKDEQAELIQTQRQIEAVKKDIARIGTEIEAANARAKQPAKKNNQQPKYAYTQYGRREIN